MLQTLRELARADAAGAPAGAARRALHVRLACDELRGQGSLRQRLHAALLLVATRAYSAVLRALDGDFNLATLARAPADGAAARLWLALARAPGVVSCATLARGLQRAGAFAPALSPAAVANSGREAPLQARYPFSAAIARMLEAPSTREALAGAADGLSLIHI